MSDAVNVPAAATEAKVDPLAPAPGVKRPRVFFDISEERFPRVKHYKRAV